MLFQTFKWQFEPFSDEDSDRNPGWLPPRSTPTSDSYFKATIQQWIFRIICDADSTLPTTKIVGSARGRIRRGQEENPWQCYSWWHTTGETQFRPVKYWHAKWRKTLMVLEDKTDFFFYMIIHTIFHTFPPWALRLSYINFCRRPWVSIKIASTTSIYIVDYGKILDMCLLLL